MNSSHDVSDEFCFLYIGQSFDFDTDDRLFSLSHKLQVKSSSYKLPHASEKDKKMIFIEQKGYVTYHMLRKNYNDSNVNISVNLS